MRTFAPSSHLAVSHGLAVLLIACLPACTFKPRIPDAVLSCATDQDCPEGFACNARIARCCRPGACADAPAPDSARGNKPDAQASASDASTEANADRLASDAGSDSEPAVPAKGTPAMASDGGADAAGSNGGGPTASVTCSGTTPVPTPEPGRQTFCTIAARDADVGLSIHTMVPGDPISARTYGVCYASLPLGLETTDPATSLGRPLPQTSIRALTDVVLQFKAICDEHKARLVGASAGQWARQANNRPAIEAQFRSNTGIDLDVATPAEEFSQVYLAVTRNRRGRAVIMETAVSPEIVTWGKGAPVLTRQPLPVSFADVHGMYMGGGYATFEDARRALRARLVRDIEPQIAALRAAVADKSIEPGFLVGPAAATVPLAVAGQLRDGQGAWSSVAQFQMKRDEATVTPSPYGRIFGPAPITPPQIDAFFASLDAGQWGQLRNDPIRAAYGGEVLYITTLLDMLADEAKATEFAFVFAHQHLGYLFAKLLPPPV